METNKTRLGQLRREAGKTIADLSQKLGISMSAISNYERGRRSPDADTLIKLAGYFGCTVDYLLGLSNTRNEESRKQDEDADNNLRAQLSDTSEEERLMLHRVFSSLVQAVTDLETIPHLQKQFITAFIEIANDFAITTNTIRYMHIWQKEEQPASFQQFEHIIRRIALLSSKSAQQEIEKLANAFLRDIDDIYVPISDGQEASRPSIAELLEQLRQQKGGDTDVET